MRSVVGDYLEAIYSLHAEGEDAFAVTLAEMFGVSRANASATLGRLSRDGLVRVDGRAISLTDAGRIAAEAGLRRHHITECFLVGVLGMEWATVHEQARSFERGLTPFLEERIDQRLGLPRTCPHGNPVPRPDLNAATYLRDRHALRLVDAPLNVPLTICTISELIEDQQDLLRYCASHNLRPGTLVRVEEHEPTGGLLLAVGARTVAAEVTLALRMWVVHQ